MSSCDNSNIRKNYIVQGGNEFDIISACTGVYTSNLYGCSPITVQDELILKSGLTFNFITNNNSLDKVLVIDSGGTINYREVSTITGGSGTNTFVTGFTYDDVNTFTISRNDDVDLISTISILSGITYYGDGSNLSGITTEDNFVSGGTYTTSTQNIDFVGTSPETTFSVNLSSLVNNITGATFVTGTTLSSNQAIVKRNDNFDVLKLSGGTGVTLSNPDTNQIKIDVSIPPGSNTYVTGGTYNEITDTVTLTRNDAVTIDITGVTDTFVTGFTYDDINTFTISRNDGTAFTQSITVLSATTISGGTFFGDGSNLSGISKQDTFVTGGTYSDLSDTISFTNNTGGTFNVTGITDTFVTGQTFSNSTYILSTTRNDGITLNTNLSVLASDVFVVSGVYNPSTGIVTYTNSTGGTFQVSGFTTGMTDSYTTDAYLSGTEIRFDNNIQGTNFYNVDLLPLLSGKTDNTTFNTYTSDTQTILDSKISGGTNLSLTGIFAQKNGDNLEFKGLTSTGGSVTITNDSTTVNLEAVIPPGTNTFVTGGTYNESTDIITLTRNDAVTIDITGVTDTFTTGATYDNGTTLATFTKNDGTTYTLDLSTIDVNDTFSTGGTITQSATSGNNEVIVQIVGNDGFTPFNITGLTDTFVTGTTFGSNQAVLTSNDGVDIFKLSGGSNVTLSNPSSNQIKIDVALPPSLNTFTTGFTYDDANTFTITRNDDVSLSSTINNVTGLTINGNLVVTGTTNISGTTTVDSTLQVDGNVNITSNSFFFQGTSVGSSNVSLIGVDSSDVIRIGNLGYNNYIVGDTTINGVLTADTIFLATLPTLNNSGTDLLVRNTTTGEIEYRPVSGITPDTNTFVTGGTYSSGTLTLDRNDNNSVVVTGFTTGGDNFYVTGFTYDDANTFTISRNGGLGDLTSIINTMTGLTVTGDLNVSGTTFYTNITGTSIGVDYIDFNNALSPLPADLEGRIYWDEDNGTLSLGMHGGQVIQQIGLEHYYYIKNQSGATIDNGRVVRAAGTLGSSGRILGEYMIADGTIPANFTLGVATEDIVDGDDGYVTEFGLVRGIDATGSLYGESWSGGTILYVSPTIPGGLTSVEPTAPDLKIEMAIVINADANGSIFVRPSRYPYLYDIQQVNYSAGTENNLDILQWNSSNLTWDKTNTPSFNSVSATTYQNLPVDPNYYVTGGTYDTTGSTINLTRNDGGTISITGVTDYYLENVTFNTSNNNMTFTLNDSSTIITNLNELDLNYYVTGGTFNNSTDTITLTRNDDVILDITGITDTFITGFTYDDANQLTLSDNYGGSLSTIINNVTGLTVNGEVNTDSIQFDTTFTATTAEGKLWWSQSHDTLHIGMGNDVVQEVGLSQFYHVGNPSGSTINKGNVVYANGVNGVDEHITVGLMIANGTIPSKFLLGVSNSTISAGTMGYISSFGLVEDINASGSLYGESWSSGDVLYVSPTTAGGLTNVEPTSPNLKLEIAFVLNNSSTEGVLFIRPTITNNIDELNDVSASSAINGDLLLYNSSNTLWESTKTLNGSYNITGTSSASTFNITNTPNTNTTDDDVLIRNSITGEIENRNINSLINTNNTITVGLTGSSGVDFYTIHEAINSITGATQENSYTVKVHGGLYLTDPVTIPSWVALQGDNSISTIIKASDPSQTMFYLSDQSAIFDCQIEGVTGTSIPAVIYSSSTTPQSLACSYIENVRFGTNYTHAKVIASGGANIIMQCSNVKYGGFPFTLGFWATNDGSGIGRMQLRNVTSTNGGIAQTTPLTFAKADAQSCGFIVNGCLLTKAAGAAAGTGFYLENGGFLRLTSVNFQRWDVGIDAPNIGNGPNINAIALNFENCNTDVNIAHPDAVGKIQGTDNFLKTKININSPFYEVNQDPREITVAVKGGDFSSIKDAVDYLALSGTSSSNRFVITVGPGTFYEDEIDLTNTPYVSIVGSNIQTTEVFPTGTTQNVFRIGQTNELSFLSIGNAGSGYAGVYCYDIGNFAQLHKVSFYDCDTNIWVESNTQDTYMYSEYVDFNGQYTYGTKTIANNGFIASNNLENYYQFPEGTGSTIANYVQGSGATIDILTARMVGNGNTGSTMTELRDYGSLNCSSIIVNNWDYGIRVLNIGGAATFDVDGISFTDVTTELSVENASTFGTLQGSASHEKIFTNSENVFWSFLDHDDGELDITRKASVTFSDGSHTDFTTLIFEGGTMGVISGGTLSEVSGTTILINSGFGYVEKSDNSGIVRRYDWVDQNLVLSGDSDTYVYINSNGVLSSGGARPDSTNNIVLGRVVTDTTSILLIDNSPLNAKHTSNKYANLFREALGPLYAFGSIVTEGTTPFTIDVSEGEYYYSTNEYLPNGGTGSTFTQYYRNGTGTTWVTSATTIVNNTQYDNNGTLSALTTSYYTKHTLYVVGDGVDEQYMLVLGQNEYATLVEAEDALLPTPPSYFIDSVAQIASIYVQQGSSGFTQVEDIRPTVGFRAGGVNASSVHGNLLGLTSDDHQQYLLADGGRAMSGNLNMGSNNITNVGTVDGVDVSAHATRHQFGGSDQVGTTTPTPNAIPYADVSGTLDSWISDSSTTTKGLTKLSVSPVSATDPIAVGDNDVRVVKAISGGSFNILSRALRLETNDFSIVEITGITDNFVTGGTITGDKILLERQNGSVILTGLNDYYVTGGTFVGSSLTLKRQDGTVTVTGFTDFYVTGGTYNSNTLTLTRNDGNDVTITGFTSGGVTSVTAGSGLSGDTTTGDITLINTAPDQTVTISGGTNIGVTGTYPDFAISYTGTSGGGLATKSGSVGGGSFAGNPKTVTITFSSAFADANYSISLSSGINRNFTYESKTSSGFVINANANTSFTEDVDWICVKHGET